MRRPSLPSNPTERRQLAKPLSTEGSIIPGETEEDGMLRREYVLVGDTRAVEFNRAVDGKNAFRLKMRLWTLIKSLYRNRLRASAPTAGQTHTPNPRHRRLHARIPDTD